MMTDEALSQNTSTSLVEEHRLLLREVKDLREWWQQLDELGTPHFGEMGMRVQSLRDHLVEHFRSEEQPGYLAAALAVAPRFSQEAAKLQSQHAELLQTLDTLISRLRAPEPQHQHWQDAWREFEQFVTALRAHESAENRIVQSAFDDDIGEGE